MQRSDYSESDGVLLCFLFNLILNYWWGALAAVFLVLYLWLGVPILLSLIMLTVWLIIALVNTALVVWAANNSGGPVTQRKNLNPYSAKNSDFPWAVKAPQRAAVCAPKQN